MPTEPATDDELEELAGEEMARELRSAARTVASEAGRELVRIALDWAKTRPLKRWIRKRRARR